MKKYIERELALSFPFANRMYDEENANIDFICGCETYKEYLESLPCLEVREWIPVTERLPENALDVLISDNIGHVEIGCYINGLWFDYDVNEYGIQDENFDLEVVAWMPLPNPYCSMGENYGFPSKEEADLWMNSKPVGKEEI